MTATTSTRATSAATDILFTFEDPDDPVLDLAMAHPRWREVSDVIASADLAEGIGMDDDHLVALRGEADRQYAQLAALVRLEHLQRAGRQRATCARSPHVPGRRSRPRARRTRTTSGARKAPVDDEPARPAQALTDETRQPGQRE